MVITMTKNFCDVCGAPAIAVEPLEKKMPEGQMSIRVACSLSMVLGYFGCVSGRGHICAKCLIEVLQPLVDKAGKADDERSRKVTTEVERLERQDPGHERAGSLSEETAAGMSCSLHSPLEIRVALHYCYAPKDWDFTEGGSVTPEIQRAMVNAGLLQQVTNGNHMSYVRTEKLDEYARRLLAVSWGEEKP